MILVGRYMSPFVRRAGIVLQTLGLAYDRQELSTADDKDAIRKINPVGRVPSLILEGGETIIDSHAIIDHALEVADGNNALLPANGPARRAILRTSFIGQGVMEKSVASSYERNRRPAEFVYQGWVDMVEEQAASGLAALNDLAANGGEWLHGDHMTLADINAVVAHDFGHRAVPALMKANDFTALAALADRCNQLPAFANTQFKG